MENLERRQIASNPEQNAIRNQAEGQSFEQQVEGVSLLAVKAFMGDGRFLGDLKAAGWPLEEGVCDELGKKHGLGAEQVAAVSKYILAHPEEGETVH